MGGTSEHKVTCDQVYRQCHRRIAPSFLWAFLGRFPDEIFGILFPEFLKNFKQGNVTKAQVDTTTVYKKKDPSTGIPCIAVRVLGLNKSFWKVFYGWIYNPYNWFTQPRARRARKKPTSPPTLLIILVDLGDFGQIPGPSSVLFGGGCVFVSLLFSAHLINCAQLIN